MGATPGAHGKQQQHFEFFGPWGPAILLFALPATLYALIYGCNSKGCLQLYPSLEIPGFVEGSQLWSSQALVAYVAWFGAVLLLHLALPGSRAEGVVLPNGKRLTYKLNGAGGRSAREGRRKGLHMLEHGRIRCGHAAGHGHCQPARAALHPSLAWPHTPASTARAASGLAVHSSAWCARVRA